jgi:hypothetical protein
LGGKERRKERKEKGPKLSQKKKKERLSIHVTSNFLNHCFSVVEF